MKESGRSSLIFNFERLVLVFQTHGVDTAVDALADLAVLYEEIILLSGPHLTVVLENEEPDGAHLNNLIEKAALTMSPESFKLYMAVLVLDQEVSTEKFSKEIVDKMKIYSQELGAMIAAALLQNEVRKVAYEHYLLPESFEDYYDVIRVASARPNIKELNVSFEDMVGHLKAVLAYMLARDYVFAIKIISMIIESDGVAVVNRGTFHVGLIHCLRTITQHYELEKIIEIPDAPNDINAPLYAGGLTPVLEATWQKKTLGRSSALCWASFCQ